MGIYDLNYGGNTTGNGFNASNIANRVNLYNPSSALDELGMGGAATAAAASPAAIGGWGGFMQGIKNTPWTNTFDPKTGMGQQGLGSTLLAGGQALLGGYLGLKNYGLAKKTFNENKRQFDMNWDAQRTNVNSQLEDRQQARVASNAGAYDSVASYMDKNRIR